VKCTGTQNEIEERRSGASTLPLRIEVTKERSASVRREERMGIFKEDLMDE